MQTVGSKGHEASVALWNQRKHCAHAQYSPLTRTASERHARAARTARRKCWVHERRGRHNECHRSHEPRYEEACYGCAQEGRTYKHFPDRGTGQLVSGRGAHCRSHRPVSDAEEHGTAGRQHSGKGQIAPNGRGEKMCDGSDHETQQHRRGKEMTRNEIKHDGSR